MEQIVSIPALNPISTCEKGARGLRGRPVDQNFGVRRLVDDCVLFLIFSQRHAGYSVGPPSNRGQWRIPGLHLVVASGVVPFQVMQELGMWSSSATRDPNNQGRRKCDMSTQARMLCNAGEFGGGHR